MCELLPAPGTNNSAMTQRKVKCRAVLPSSRAGRRVRQVARRGETHANVPVRRGRREPLEFRVDPSDAGPKRVFVTCHYCSYSPDIVPADGICPKCGGRSWERFALSARLLPRERK